MKWLAALALLASPALAQTAPTAPPAPAPGAIIGVSMFVSDKAKALHFYVNGLGMTVNMTMGPPTRQETMLGFGLNPRSPSIILLNDTTAKAPMVITHGTGYNRLVMRMANLDATAARLKAAGFSPSPIKDVAMGYRMMTVTDPDGYRLELVESKAKQ